MATLRYVTYRFQRWRRSPKVVLVFLLITIFITTPSLFLSNISKSQSKTITPWLFPFIMCDRFVLMCVMLSIIFMFSDVPACDETRDYIVLRIGRKFWILGEILYIIVTSLLLMTYIWAYSLAINVQNLSFDFAWGDILLSFASPSIYRGIGIGQLTNIYRDPLEACFLCYGLSIEACIFLGLLVLFLSIKHSKTIGILIGCCFAILDFVIYYILEDYPSVFFFSPISWVDISCLTGNIYPTIRYAILSVSVLIIALIWFCIRLIKSRDELPVI